MNFQSTLLKITQNSFLCIQLDAEIIFEYFYIFFKARFLHKHNNGSIHVAAFSAQNKLHISVMKNMKTKIKRAFFYRCNFISPNTKSGVLYM